jgi:hypothetical protein
MLRQAELFRVVGRRLSERLIAAKLIEPVRVGSGIFFDAYKLHRALGRLGRSHRPMTDLGLNGHVQGLRVETTKVHTRTVEDLVLNLSLDDL